MCSSDLKTIVESAKEMTRLLEIYEHKRNWQVYKQKGSGRNFRQSDFRAEHLRIIYDLFNDDMVKFFLDGRIKPMKPNLVKQFWLYHNLEIIRSQSLVNPFPSKIFLVFLLKVLRRSKLFRRFSTFFAIIFFDMVGP